jgi:hypothetical protein
MHYGGSDVQRRAPLLISSGAVSILTISVTGIPSFNLHQVCIA